MNLTINGEKRAVSAQTVQQLIEELNLQSRRVAAMVNGDVVKRVSFAEHALHENDEVELISLIGGG